MKLNDLIIGNDYYIVTDVRPRYSTVFKAKLVNVEMYMDKEYLAGTKGELKFLKQEEYSNGFTIQQEISDYLKSTSDRTIQTPWSDSMWIFRDFNYTNMTVNEDVCLTRDEVLSRIEDIKIKQIVDLKQNIKHIKEIDFMKIHDFTKEHEEYAKKSEKRNEQNKD